MTQTFLIGSRVATVLPVPVQGTGDNSLTAERNALVVAQKLKGIQQPAIARGHEGAAMYHRWAQKQRIELIRSARLEGSSPMCFDNRYESYQFN